MDITKSKFQELVRNSWAMFHEDMPEFLEEADVEGELTATIYLESSSGKRRAVGFRCSKNLAEEFAKTAFGKAADSIDEEFLLDVVGELTNIIGGTLTGALSADYQLNPPEIGVFPSSTQANGKDQLRLQGRCGDERFELTLNEAS